MALNGSYFNETLLEGNDSVVSIVEATILAVCLMLSLISNTFILVILYKVKNCFEAMQQFIFKALAVTDFLTGIFCCGLTLVTLLFGVNRWFSSAMCAIRGVACTGFTGLSALLIACACIDRFIAIVFPLRYSSLVTIKRARIVLLIVCAVTIINSALSTIGRRQKTNLCLANFSSDNLSFRPSLVIGLLILCTSLVVAIITNIKVMIVTSSQTRRSSIESPDNGKKGDITTQSALIKRQQGSRRGLLVLIATTVIFFLIISPFFIVSASQFSKKTNFGTPLARFVSGTLLMSNSWMNAWIFLAFNRRFRVAAKKVLRRDALDDEESSNTSSSS